MDADKAVWLGKMGIRKLDKPHASKTSPQEELVYRLDIADGRIHYSRDRIERTPLRKLKAVVKRHIWYIKKRSEARRREAGFSGWNAPRNCRPTTVRGKSIDESYTPSRKLLYSLAIASIILSLCSITVRWWLPAVLNLTWL